MAGGRSGAARARDTYELVCQVNGKLRDRVHVADGARGAGAKTLALAQPNVQAHVDGHEIARVIVIPGKLVNVVVR